MVAKGCFVCGTLAGDEAFNAHDSQGGCPTRRIEARGFVLDADKGAVDVLLVRFKHAQLFIQGLLTLAHLREQCAHSNLSRSNQSL